MRVRYFSAHTNCSAVFFEAESPDDGVLRIYGTVTMDGAAIEATVSLSGADSFSVVVIDSNYGFPTLKPGRYRVTPSQPGVIFTPASQDVELTNGISDQVVNFAGTRIGG